MIESVREIVRLSLFAFTFALILSCGSCDRHPVGGPCTYDSVKGTAKFTTLNTVAGGVEAYFDFTPDDQSAIPRFTNDKNRKLFAGGSSPRLPTSEEITSNGITVGSILPAIRVEMTAGTCTPWGYTFTNLSTGLSGQ